MTSTTLTSQELGRESTQETYVLVDVRTPGEYREAHVPGSSNVPLADLKRFESELSQAASQKELVLVCRTGRRAELARERLSKAGITRARVLEGGIEAWAAEGRETKKGKLGISIERQVRIAAGSLVLLGGVLGFLIHPGFHWLSGFVGAGLIFAGITDTCGMATVLGRLPFNRVRLEHVAPAPSTEPVPRSSRRSTEGHT